MRFSSFGVAGAVAASLLLSACAGAMMAMGPAALPIGMMVAAPMESSGMFGEMAGAPENPALRRHPVLGDADLVAQQAELISQHAAFTADLDGQVSAANALECSFDEATVWLLAHSMSKRDYEAAMAGLPPDIQPRHLARQASLLEGDCAADRPEGAFVAVASHESVQGTGATAIWTNERRRLSGTMRDGELEGQLLLETVSLTESSSLGRLGRHVSHAMVAYDAGTPAGASLHLTFIYDQAGNLTQVLTQVHEWVAPGSMAVTVWAGEALFQEYTMRDGQMHGWMVMHPVEFVSGYPSAATRTCWHSGQEAPASVCSALASR